MAEPLDYRAAVAEAAGAIRASEAIVIGAGAGLSVDSGIPAYRLNPREPVGEQPAQQAALPGPLLFRHDPALAWSYAAPWIARSRSTQPHKGYEVLRRWSKAMPNGGFVITSNVDGQFQSSGFGEEVIVEGHGSMAYLQCVEPCNDAIWSASELVFEGEQLTELPRCPSCGREARPNVFMFGDPYFNPRRTERQLARLDRWLEAIVGRRLVVVECGAGTAVPTIRKKCEELSRRSGGPLVRINLLEAQCPSGAVSIPMRAREALLAIDEQLAHG